MSNITDKDCRLLSRIAEGETPHLPEGVTKEMFLATVLLKVVKSGKEPTIDFYDKRQHPPSI